MVSVLASSAVDRGYEPRSDQTQEYKIVICCFSAKNAELRRKSKDWLARNQDNVSGDVTIYKWKVYNGKIEIDFFIVTLYNF
jgi:hypothetical protein